MELHNIIRPSSRMKDLVDLCTIATHESIQLRALSYALRSETQNRNLGSVSVFSIPSVWYSEEKRYTKTAKDANLSNSYYDLSKALELVESFVNPAFDLIASEKQWLPDLLVWK